MSIQGGGDAFYDDAGGQPILSPSAPMLTARAFIARHHTKDTIPTLHHQNASFYAWHGSHYAERTTEEMRADVWKFLDGAKKPDRDGDLVPFNPTRSTAANAMEALAAVAQMPPYTRAPAWLDGRPSPAPDELIACSNGLLHLPTMRLLHATPAFFNVNALGFAYDPCAAPPAAWLAFLADLWPSDAESIDTLQELFGLLLTNDTRYQKAFLIVGPKRSGKGTIARVATDLIGAANVCGPTLSSLTGTFGLQPLIAKRLALISDARLSGKVDQSVITERLLSVTGEDGQSVDRKNQTAWFGKLDARFVILTNELPNLRDASGALAGRFVILRTTQTFYGREDLGLFAKLRPELPGILLWAIEGWRRLTARGYFITPASAREAQADLENLGSPIGAFVRDCCEVGPGLSVQVSNLYAAWSDWCRKQGRDHPGTVQGFGRDMAAAIAGLHTANLRTNGGARARYFEGVTITPESANLG
jgi:putative DNA primase/helicase